MKPPASVSQGIICLSVVFLAACTPNPNEVTVSLPTEISTLTSNTSPTPTLTLIPKAETLTTSMPTEVVIPTENSSKISTTSDSSIFRDSGQRLTNLWLFTTAVASGDIDRDGDIDLFVTYTGDETHGATNKVWLNDGTGNFRDSGQNLGIGYSTDVALGDLDSDGDLDAFVVNTLGDSSRVWLNDGKGTFSAGQILGKYGWSIALGDLDSDNDLDALIVGNLRGNQVWLNDGKGNFSDSIKTPDGRCLDVALGDIDGDNDLDAFIGILVGPEETWLNNGIGNFSKSGRSLDSPTENDGHAVALGDFDKDDDLDAFVSDYNSIQIWLNDSRGNFKDSGQTFDQSLDNFEVGVGDIDKDNDLDLIVANYGRNMIWLNNGTGIFSSQQGPDNLRTCAVALADFDNDDDLDVFVGGCLDPDEIWFNNSR